MDINTLGTQEPRVLRPQNSGIHMERQNTQNDRGDPRIQIITQLPNQRNVIYKNNMTSQFRRLEPSTSKNSEQQNTCSHMNLSSAKGILVSQNICN